MVAPCSAPEKPSCGPAGLLTAALLKSVARPFGSSHIGPVKRALSVTSAEFDSLDFPVRKRRAVGKGPEIRPLLPIVETQNAKPGPECKHVKSVDVDGTAAERDGVIENALRVFDDLWSQYVCVAGAQGEAKACEVAEESLGDRYEEVRDAFASLLPLADLEEVFREQSGDRQYDVYQFRGCNLPRALCGVSVDVQDKIAHIRTASPIGQAREALCALLSALSTRAEKSWLDAYDLDDELKHRQRAFKDESSADLCKAVLASLRAKQARGYFAHALGSPTSTLRIALAAPRASGYLPASLLVTHLLPLEHAFAKMDDDGPLRRPPRKWCHREYALQDLTPDACEPQVDDFHERRPTRDLVSEPAIAELIRSGAPVVLLDAVAALAPRKFARERGVSEVVREELAGLLRGAKEEGRAVVFMLADNPHTLARKVYLRKPFTDFGLRVGYLRWRNAVGELWAREKPQDQRVCIGLQLP